MGKGAPKTDARTSQTNTTTIGDIGFTGKDATDFLKTATDYGSGTIAASFKFSESVLALDQQLLAQAHAVQSGNALSTLTSPPVILGIVAIATLIYLKKKG